MALHGAAQAQYAYSTNFPDTNTITITGYTGAGGNVAIPSSIAGKTVTGIGDWAFQSCDLTGVAIPDSVTNVGDEAFLSCHILTNVIFGNGVARIGNNAFQSCSILRSIAIPDSVANIGNTSFAYCGLTNVALGAGVTNIGNYAFSSCSSLRFITIPANVANIGAGAFFQCESLAAITVDAGNSVYSSTNGVLFDRNKTVLVLCPEAKTGIYSIPAGVIGIGGSAFEGCSGLTRIAIPDSVVGIGDWAFNGCFGLTNVAIGAGVAGIGQGAFSACFNLIEIAVNAGNTVYSSSNGVLFDRNKTTLLLCPGGKTGNYSIPAGVADIADEAFADCRLTGVEIPDSVVNIGHDAFYWCTSLTNVAIGNGVTNIGDSAFQNCSLVRVAIPNSVSRIGDGAFRECSGLTNIALGAGVIGIGYGAFSGCGNLAVIAIPNNVVNIGQSAFSGCSGLADVTLGNGVADIAGSAFTYCSSLTNVAIGAGVTNIGGYAFAWCSSLRTITIPAGVASIEDLAFHDCTNLAGVYFLGDAPAVNSYWSDPPSSAAFENTIATIYRLQSASGWPPVPELWDNRPTALWGEMPALEIAPASTNVSAAAATGRQIAVAASAAWTATANVPWLAIADGGSGSGNGTVFFSVAAHAGVAARTGTIVVAGGGLRRTCTVVQAEGWAGAPWPLPGTVEMENFDFGGAGAAYLDTTATNEGGVYRPGEGVDIGEMSEAGNGYVVGWTPAGEWLQYTVDVAAPGAYTIETSVAGVGAGGGFRVLFNGVDKTGLLNVPDTGAWYAYQTVGRTGVALSAGIQTVRVSMVSAGTSGNVGAFDWFRVAAEFPRVQADADFGVISNRFGFNVAWDEGQTVVVDACTNLAKPVWMPLQTNVLAGGNFYFSHPGWTNHSGLYYRLRSP